MKHTTSTPIPIPIPVPMSYSNCYASPLRQCDSTFKIDIPCRIPYLNSDTCINVHRCKYTDVSHQNKPIKRIESRLRSLTFKKKQ